MMAKKAVNKGKVSKKKKSGVMGVLMSNKKLRYMASLKPLIYMTYLLYGLLALTVIGILISMIGK